MNEYNIISLELGERREGRVGGGGGGGWYGDCVTWLELK